MSWIISADKFDNEQKQFIFEESKKNGNKWLKGFPGTGKSILLINLILKKMEDNPNVFIAVVIFTNSLREMFEVAMIESGIPYNNVYLTTYHKFIKEDFHYEYIFCDEVQDLPQSVLENIRSRCNQLIVAGDENQSIYEKDPMTREAVVDISKMKDITKSEPYELETIHRLTKSIVKSVSYLLPTMNIESAKMDTLKKDMTIRLIQKKNEEEEVKYILSKSKEVIENRSESTVVILPTHQDITDFIKIVFKLNNVVLNEFPQNKWGKIDYTEVNNLLKINNINLEYLGNNYGNLYKADKSGKIIIMSYYSAKGLEFDTVFLAFQSRGFDNLYLPKDYDDSEKKTLFMVGMTRSRGNLYLTYSTVLPSYIETFKHLCTSVENNNDLETNDEFNFDF